MRPTLDSLTKVSYHLLLSFECKQITPTLPSSCTPPLQITHPSIYILRPRDFPRSRPDRRNCTYSITSIHVFPSVFSKLRRKSVCVWKFHNYHFSFRYFFFLCLDSSSSLVFCHPGTFSSLLLRNSSSLHQCSASPVGTIQDPPLLYNPLPLL